MDQNEEWSGSPETRCGMVRVSEERRKKRERMSEKKTGTKEYFQSVSRGPWDSMVTQSGGEDDSRRKKRTTAKLEIQQLSLAHAFNHW